MMTAKEEAALHARYLKGDVDAGNKLTAAVWAWACKCIRRNPVAVRYRDDDVESAAGLAIATALRSYRPDRGRLTTLIWHISKTQVRDRFQQFRPMLSMNRRAHADGNQRSLDWIHFLRDRHSVMPIDDVADAERLSHLQSAFTVALESVRMQDATAAEVLRLRFCGMRTVDIARQVGIPEGTVWRYEKLWWPVLRRNAQLYLTEEPPAINPVMAEPMPDRGKRKNVRPTHCKRGHEFSPDNTYTKPDGTRCCRKCKDLRRHRRERT